MRPSTSTATGRHPGRHVSMLTRIGDRDELGERRLDAAIASLDEWIPSRRYGASPICSKPTGPSPYKVRAFRRAAAKGKRSTSAELLARLSPPWADSPTSPAWETPRPGSSPRHWPARRPLISASRERGKAHRHRALRWQLRVMLQGDCHSHSDWSDGGSPIAEMAEAAQTLGHQYLALTDHSPRLTVAHGLNAERLEQPARGGRQR